MFEADNNIKYKIKAICNSAIYINEIAEGQLPKLYYLVFYKDNPKLESTWESILTVFQLRKLINIFHKKNWEKPIAISASFDSTPQMIYPLVKILAIDKALKLNQRYLVKAVNGKDGK